MAKNKRNRNKENIERSSKLVKEIKSDKKKVPAWVPPAYISRTDAKRREKLTENELDVLKDSAIFGVRKGQPGIFYSPMDINTLVLQKRSVLTVDQEMLSEATIIKQLPKDYFDPEFMEDVRSLGVKGSRPGHRGRETHFFSLSVIKEHFHLHVIHNSSVEAEDFVLAQNVPFEVQLELSNPLLCIWTEPGRMAERCYVKAEEVQKIHDLCEPFSKQLRRSGRSKAVDSSGVLADGSKVAEGSDMSDTAEGSVLGETAEGSVLGETAEGSALGETAEGSRFAVAGKSLEQLSDWFLSDEDEEDDQEA